MNLPRLSHIPAPDWRQAQEVTAAQIGSVQACVPAGADLEAFDSEGWLACWRGSRSCGRRGRA